MKVRKKDRENLYLKVRKAPFGDELWISPAGDKEEYFLTDDKITYEEIKEFKAT